MISQLPWQNKVLPTQSTLELGQTIYCLLFKNLDSKIQSTDINSQSKMVGEKKEQHYVEIEDYLES